MEVKLKKQANMHRMELAGELSIYDAAELKQKLLNALEKSQELEIDLSQVNEMDTAGIQVLILAKREAQHHNKTLRLVNHSEATLDVLETYGMADYFGDPLVISAKSEKSRTAQGK